MYWCETLLTKIDIKDQIKINNKKRTHIKIEPSPSKKVDFIYFNESPLKMISDAPFYFILKVFFVLKIFKTLFCIFSFL